ncbi:mechanosensitive ion channel domain-containing protein [Falsirhodobacter deserti]|uniref:mechanosensitive ion channel domain-containing protein n=1 Tax=Falsirhodobacter deserti TaxID=1365611 RepID=UPI000FE2A52C|nr:mechanosensitive ion channel domain-containing protein [Falsirhodobacter deserti]
MILRTLFALLIALLPIGSWAQETPADPAATVSSTEAVQALLNVLQDEQARTALIERLQADETAAEPAAEAAPPPALAQQVAESTASAGREVISELARVWQQLMQSVSLVSQLWSGGTHQAEAIQLVMTIFTTIVIGLVMIRIANAIAGRHSPPPTAGFWLRMRATLIVTLLRACGIALSWAVGYALASFVFSRTGSPSASQTLYLNAFLMFGMVRVVLRAINSPEADTEPTLSVLAPGAQAVIYRNLTMVSGIVIQGLLFIVPLTRIWLGFAAVRPMRTLIATIAAIAAIIAIRRMSKALHLARGDRLTGNERDAGSAVASGVQHAWQRAWPVLTLIYIAYSWFIAVTRPALIESVVLRGTIYMVIAVFILLIGMRLLRSATNVNVKLPELLVTVSPALGRRTNAVVMVLAWIAAAFLILFAISVALSGWGWVETNMLYDPTMQAVIWRVLSAVLIALFATVIWAVVDGWIEYKLANGIAGQAATNRTKTLLSLFRNGFTIALVIVATMITLSQIGINIAPLLAGAGVIGLAIGFGAQKLVQDVITGVFIQLENAINVGDVVAAGGVSGGVERVNIRTVRLRALDGSVYIVPFSSVDTVQNMTRDFGAHLAEIGVAYDTDVDVAKAALNEAYDRLMKDPELSTYVTQPLEMQGVIAFGDNAVVIRCRVMTLPGKHWPVGRRFNELVKQVFDERGIEIPFPQRTLHISTEASKAISMSSAAPAIEGTLAKSVEDTK